MLTNYVCDYVLKNWFVLFFKYKNFDVDVYILKTCLERVKKTIKYVLISNQYVKIKS